MQVTHACVLNVNHWFNKRRCLCMEWREYLGSLSHSPIIDRLTLIINSMYTITHRIFNNKQTFFLYTMLIIVYWFLIVSVHIIVIFSNLFADNIVSFSFSISSNLVSSWTIKHIFYSILLYIYIYTQKTSLIYFIAYWH